MKANGLILKMGNRRSSKHYRIYTNKKNNLLRFEAEMKSDLIKDFQDLLITSSFEEYEFESNIAYQFFKYSFELLCLPQKGTTKFHFKYSKNFQNESNYSRRFWILSGRASSS